MVAKKKSDTQSQTASASCRAPTAFEQRLYAACKRIPKGKVTTYGTLAKLLNSSARAVGQGMRRNPFAPVVPCHRVVASDLRLGGFKGSWGEEAEHVKCKRVMLEGEGVSFSLQQERLKVASPAFVVQLGELQALCEDL